MKKIAKITGIILLALIGLLAIVFLLARFAFRDQAVSYLNGIQRRERVELLRNSRAYAADTIRYAFTYMQDSTHARKIRDYFRLDTLLRSNASTWDNTLALAKFVAGNIPHANQSVYPDKCNAISLWEYHLNVEPAFNCRLHSILLHELLLASGITNRFVTCLPVDHEDSDCHVVNIVWLPEMRKWAMIDSDMQAFMTDPDGTPLSLEEMRGRYIGDETIVINRLFDDEKNTDYYRAYWAKNLYWFICWEAAEYDKEIEYEGRIVVLRPQGFDGFGLDESAIMTTDEARFWAAPDADTILLKI